MKVLLLNGSPRGEKCTYTALKAAAEVFYENGIETEIFHIGSDSIRGCIGCGTCFRTKSGKCTFDNDNVNSFIDKMKDCDGLIVGSPVHYAAAGGAISSFLDRAFYAGSASFAHKLGAAIVSCRRGGASAALDQLNKYFTIAQMPIVSSNYWNMVHGNTPEEVLKDEEGIQTVRILAKNMAWLLKSIEAGKNSGIEKPDAEQKVRTNFIR